MSVQHNEDEPETLFSLEFLVEFVQLDKRCEVSDELAVAVRLLDFPTLLIYQPQHSSSVQKQEGEYIFNRGKCCFFKMNLHLLHVHLSDTPLYVMVLDVSEEVPRLVGSSLVSLAAAMHRIRRDASERGVSSPSSHRERRLVSVCSLTGKRIGSISLSSKLLCLGASLLPHITETRGLKGTSVSGGEEVRDQVKEGDKSTHSLPLVCQDAPPPVVYPSDLNTNNEAEKVAIGSNQDERECTDATAEGVVATENKLEDMNMFCPPRLYYSNTEEERCRRQKEDFKSINSFLEALVFEDSSSEDGEVSSKVPSFPAMQQKATAETSTVTPNVLGEALRKMPVLKALFVELSQLNVLNADHSLIDHPSPGQKHKPDSAEMSPHKRSGHRSTPRTSGGKSRQDTSLNLKPVHSPRNCSTPVAQVRTKTQQDSLIESHIKSPRKKLAHGTTKASTLRLKQLSVKAKPRECVKLLQKETQSSPAKGGIKSKINIKSSKRKTIVEKSSNLNKNVETVIQSAPVVTPQRGTVTQRKKTKQGQARGKQNKDASKISEPQLPEQDLKCIRIPSADSDHVSQSQNEKQHRSESGQSQLELNSDGEIIESAGSSSSSSLSDSSTDVGQVVDYADDFNSLASSDAFSPDPACSPERSRAQISKSPICSDVCNSDISSENARNRAALLPVPVQAPSSPQHALRGTHVIRPRLQTSALSFSSDDINRRMASSESTNSGKQMTASSSRAESLITPGGQKGESAESRGPAREGSAESISSFEPVPAGEVEDELGSLDFRREYQDISQLVTSKLPGYTL